MHPTPTPRPASHDQLLDAQRQQRHRLRRATADPATPRRTQKRSKEPIDAVARCRHALDGDAPHKRVAIRCIDGNRGRSIANPSARYSCCHAGRLSSSNVNTPPGRARNWRISASPGCRADPRWWSGRPSPSPPSAPPHRRRAEPGHAMVPEHPRRRWARIVALGSTARIHRSSGSYESAPAPTLRTSAHRPVQHESVRRSTDPLETEPGVGSTVAFVIDPRAHCAQASPSATGPVSAAGASTLTSASRRRGCWRRSA